MKFKIDIKQIALSIAMILFFGTDIIAQKKHLYSVGVKQSFRHWGGCSSDPDFDYAEFELLKGNSALEKIVIRSDKLNQLVTFNHEFKFNNEITSISELLTEIKIHTRASDIINDKHLHYSFKAKNLLFGKVDTVRDASDPCNNFISHNREGYSMISYIYVDNPISVKEDGGSRYVLDYDVLTLITNDYYRNWNSERPYLQVALDDGTNNWNTIKNISISPKSKIKLTYTQIAGEKENPNSNYYKWMGKSLKFRIVKTLINNKKTYGNIAAGIAFYPKGLQYSILQTRRSHCSNKVSIYIELENSADKGYFNLDPELFYWVTKPTSSGDRYKCEMKATGKPLIYKIITTNETDDSEIDPFSEPNTEPIEWTLQLIEKSNTSSYACNRKFTIPAKPVAITIKQKPETYTINNLKYHVPSINNPFVVLEINDPDDFAHMRRPYKIVLNSDTIATIDKLPDTYSEMSQKQKDSINAIIDHEYDSITNLPNNPYRSYFKLKLSKWLKDNPKGINLDFPERPYPFKFSHDGSFLLFESNNNIYKATINSDGIYSYVKKTNYNGFSSADISVISPDDKFYIYTFQGRSIWKASTNGSEVDNGTKIHLPFEHEIDDYTSFCARNQRVFLDNDNIVIGRLGWSGGNGIYRKNLKTGALTLLYNCSLTLEPQVISGSKKILFRGNGDVYNWNIGTISGNTLTNVKHIFTSKRITLSKDQTYAIGDKDGKTYKFTLTGSNPGTATLAIDREIGGRFVLTKSNTCYYYYHGTRPDRKDRGVYRSDLNGGIGERVLYAFAGYFDVSPDEKFLIYMDSDTGKCYKLYLGVEEASQDFYPNKGIAQSWYNDYKAIYKEKWLNNRIGIRVSKNIEVNKYQDLVLVDGDKCSYPFTIHVKAPKEGSFTTSVVKNPSDACAKDGEVKVTYNGGGVPPYINASGELRTIGNSIVVKGMGYGENTIFFTDAYGQESSPLKVTIGSSTQGITDVVAHDQTCDPANGSIKITIGSISGTKTYKLIDNDNSKSYTKQTTANTHTFTGLPNGKYSAYVTSGTCSFAKENIPVDYKVFSIKDIIPTDALVIGGSGDVTINFTNRTGNINWLSGVPSVFNPTDNKNSVHYTSILPGTYNFSAKHTDIYNKGCDISGSFTIDKPEFELTINTDETEEGLSISVNLTSGNALIVPYRFTIKRSDGNTEASGQNNSSFGATITRNGSYSLNMSYGSNTVKIYDFSYPSPTITESHLLTPIKCPGAEGLITVSPTGGIDGTDLTYSTDGVTFNNTKTYTTKAGYFEYSVRDKNTEYADISGNPVTIKRNLTNSFRINIPKPDNVSATVNPVDITCNGLNNGKIIVQNAAGGSGSYQYRVNTGTWTDIDNVTTGLAPGEHTVYIKDSGNNCSEVTLTTTTISEPPILEIDSVRVVQPKCELPNGELYIRVKGGNGSYKFNWIYNGNPYSNSDDFTTNTESYLGHELNHGTYSLTVSDSKSCEVSHSTILKQYHNPKINNVDITNVRCNNETNGSAKITDISGTTNISAFNIQAVGTGYTNQINNINESFTNLKKGVYNITATDDSSCVSNVPFPITIKEPEVAIHTVIGDIIPSLYKNVNGGRIHYTIKGGNEGLKTVQLLDSGNNEAATTSERNDYPLYFNNLYADDYKIKVTDIKGCSHTSDVQTIKEPEKTLGFIIVDKKDARCKASTGEFTVEAFGGWGEYKYRLATDNGFYNTNIFRNRYAGSYTITVRDKMGAEFSDNVIIHEPKEELQADISDIKAPTCGTNGTISVDIKGGTAPYKLFFENETDTIYISNPDKRTVGGRPTGSFTMQLRDKNGCIFKNQTELSDGDMLKINNVEFTYPTNSISEDGAIKANAWGGSAPLTYNWKSINGNSLPDTDDQINNISSGYYTVTAIEQDGCSVSKQIYLPATTDMVLDIITINHEQSYLANDGSAQLKTKLESLTDIEIIDPDGTKIVQAATESTPLLNINGKNLHLNNLKGGEYYVVAKNIHGEREFTPLLIKAYRRFFFKDINAINTRKMNDPSGSITIAVEGGAGENNYKWQFPTSRATTPIVQNSDNTSSIESAIAGEYKLTVTDKFNNSITETVTIKQPDAPLDITVADFANESCKGYKDAWVTLKAEGGWGEYQYRQDVKEHYINDQLWRNLDVRKHYFYITDKMGVTDSVAIDIKEPEYVRTKLKLIDSVDCKNGADGKVMFNVKGGTKPYRFRLKNEPDIWTNDTTARDLKSGNYTYIFTDKNNCTGQDTMKIYVPEPDSLLFRDIDVTHTTCNSNNGVINITMKGGTRPYKYQWTDLYGNNLGTTNAVNNLEQNSRYNVSITDAHNCIQHHQQLIKPSTKPVIDIINTTPVLCHGGATGTATITKTTAAVPFAPYSFKWSNNNTGESSVGYKAGSYSVTITDDNNCKTTKKFEITEPDTLRLSVTDFKDVHCFGYNDGYIEVNASGGIGDYKYNWTNGATTNRIESLLKGTYGVKITDKNDCIFEKSFEITEPEKLTVDLGKDIKMCPGNSIDVDGQDFTTHKWYNKNGVITNERFIKINKQDEYYLEVTNNIGCFARDTINVFIGNDALKADFLMPSEAALNDTIFIYEISNISLDSMKWEYKKDIFTDITEVSLPEYILHLKSKQMGMYNVALKAYSGGCVSTIVKQVEIVDENGNSDDDENIGYTDPLILEITIYPNPTDGNFIAKVKLREVADIELSLFSINYGSVIDKRERTGLKTYEVGYQLGELNTGVYVLMVVSGKERKQVKIVVK